MTDKKNVGKWIEGCISAENMYSALTLINYYISNFDINHNSTEKEKVKSWIKQCEIKKGKKSE